MAHAILVIIRAKLVMLWRYIGDNSR